MAGNGLRVVVNLGGIRCSMLGRDHGLMRDNGLRELKNRVRSDKRRFGDYDGLMRYNRLRGTKSEGRSNKMRFGAHGINGNLMECNSLRELKNWEGSSERRGDGLGDNNSVVVRFDGRRCEYLLRRNELGGFRRLWGHRASRITAGRPEDRGRRLIVDTNRRLGRDGLRCFEGLRRSDIGGICDFLFVDCGGINLGRGIDS